MDDNLQNENKPEETPQTNLETTPAKTGPVICPNCMEPVPEGQRICPSCGWDLDKEPEEKISDPTAGTPVNPVSAVSNPGGKEGSPDEKKREEKKKNNMSNLMQGLGIYIIYYAISNMVSARKLAPKEKNMAFIADLIYLIAGIMLVWPLIKKGIRKLKGIPDEPSDSQKTEDKAVDEAKDTDQPQKTDQSPISDADSSHPEDQSQDVKEANVSPSEDQPEANGTEKQDQKSDLEDTSSESSSNGPKAE